MMKTDTRLLGLVALAATLFAGSGRAQDVMVTGRVAVARTEDSSPKQADSSDVVIWLEPISQAESGTQNYPHPAEPARLRLLQKSKQFSPHVLVVRVGSAVEFPNLDPFFHNVFSLFNGKRFDLGLYEAGTTRSVKFDRPGVAYIFCNIHPQMSAVVVAVDTPYFAVSDRQGDIKIPNVPPGRYRFDVWYERALPETLRALRREITVGPDAASLGDLSLTASTDIFVAHRNKYGREYDPPTPPGSLYQQP
jgi:plastocyanin